jgi:hypothetical protein
VDAPRCLLYSLNITARGLTGDAYAVTFRYDDGPEIPHIAEFRRYGFEPIDPCAGFD